VCSLPGRDDAPSGLLSTHGSSEEIQLIDSSGSVIGTPSDPDSDADGFNPMEAPLRGFQSQVAGFGPVRPSCCSDRWRYVASATAPVPLMWTPSAAYHEEWDAE
jgi:hypothetical protein